MQCACLQLSIHGTCAIHTGYICIYMYYLRMEIKQGGRGLKLKPEVGGGMASLYIRGITNVQHVGTHMSCRVDCLL